MLIRARIVLPVSQPTLENGAVLLDGNCISKVGPWNELRGLSDAVVDLGESILLPGLINAHCHLDYTDMAGLISKPKHFSDWIKGILALKASWSYSEYARSWTHGAQMLLESGTTSVADIEAVPELIPDVWHATPLRVQSFLEMTGVKSNRDPAAILQEALNKISELPSGKNSAGLSPHSLYSTTPELIRLSASAARERNLFITTHVAESLEEFEMFTRQRGPLFDWLKTQRTMSDCTGLSPIARLQALGALSEHFLAVHVNHLAERDAEILATHGASVVHCPRSHAYFQHQSFPLHQLQTAGVNVCLGTDSLASMTKTRGEKCELNIFDEMRTVAESSGISPQTVIQMATVNGAKALGRQNQLGSITEGFLADMIALPCSGTKEDPYEQVLGFQGKVSASLIDGGWAISPTV